MAVRITAAARSHSRAFSGDVAGLDDEPGSERPMTSMAVAMVLAVYMPPQAPADGQECCSRSSRTSEGVAGVPFGCGQAAWSLL